MGEKLLKTRTAKSITQLEPIASPAPWGLLLANGLQCRLRNGGSWGGRADGYVGAYYCGPGDTDFVLANADAPVVEQSTPLWTVRVGPLGEPDELFPEPSTVAVAIAYFAGTPQEHR